MEKVFDILTAGDYLASFATVAIYLISLYWITRIK